MSTNAKLRILAGFVEEEGEIAKIPRTVGEITTVVQTQFRRGYSEGMVSMYVSALVNDGLLRVDVEQKVLRYIPTVDEHRDREDGRKVALTAFGSRKELGYVGDSKPLPFDELIPPTEMPAPATRTPHKGGHAMEHFASQSLEFASRSN